jgi:hypothetical protein
MDKIMQNLMKSKAIMDRADGIKGSGASNSPSNMLQDFNIPQAKYNIPQEYMQEQNRNPNQPMISSLPPDRPMGVPNVESIKNSKLPDEIKRLMMEHPIAQAQQPTTTISNELIEKAARLMKEGNNNYVPDSAKPKTAQPQQTSNVGNVQIDYKLIKKMINEAVNDALSENGLIMESSEKSNEIFSFKVGKHIFEGKVTKIKKLS